MPKLFIHQVIFWIFICLVFFGLRLVHLSAINFGSDAARDFLVMWNIYTTKHLVLIGPPSEYSIMGRQFFFGPAPYYIILPALVLGDWDPLAVSYFLIFLNGITLFISLYILSKNIKEKLTVYYFAIFCTFTPWLVTYTQSYWNPYLMLPVSTLLVALIVKSRSQKKNSLLVLLIGFLFGLGMQFHYSFIFAIVLSCIWLFLNKKISLNSLAFLGGGFVIGFFPLILFELRNHFYNLTTVLFVLTHAKDSTTGFIPNSFYLISLQPFLFYLASTFFGKIQSPSRLFISLFLGVYIAGSVLIILSPHKSTLSYSDAKKVATKIEQNNPENFNVVDQLTLDNRATSVRYLLTVQGHAPMGVTDYSHARTLFIYSKQPFTALVKNPIWEIKSFMPFTHVKTQDITETLKLYILEK